MICYIVSPRDTKTPSENPDGVLVSCPRCAPTRPKARAGCVALRLAARFGRVRAPIVQSHRPTAVNPHGKLFRPGKLKIHPVRKPHKAAPAICENAANEKSHGHSRPRWQKDRNSFCAMIAQRYAGNLQNCGHEHFVQRNIARRNSGRLNQHIKPP